MPALNQLQKQDLSSHHLTPQSRLQHTLLSVLRSSSFLATFIATIWSCICTVRNATHQDTALGPLLGSFLCGFSIFLERKSRRGELALYTFPRALYSFCYRWTKGSVLGRVPALVSSGAQLFLLTSSIGVVVQYLVHEPEMLRPSVRSGLGYLLLP